MTKYGFIGTGSMGSMLVEKFIESGMILPCDCSVSSKTGISAGALGKKTGVRVAESNRALAKDADLLFICVKPLEVCHVIREIRNVLKPDTLLVSIAGGVTLVNILDWAGAKLRCARVIPSVTAEQGLGVSLVVWSRNVKTQDKKLIISLFNAIGTTVETNERDIDRYSDLTSCAPGFMAAMMKEFACAAVRTGTIEPDLAEYLVKETFTGTARILSGNMTFNDIISRVATKGGITETGVHVLHTRLPAVFDELLSVTSDKHQSRQEKICDESKRLLQL